MRVPHHDSLSHRSTQQRQSILASGVSRIAMFGVAIALSSQAAYAQDAASSEAVESEIVVTGVRAGIMRSLDAKRKADSIVDTISAEDIGKFPDNNIAEAVQRIPGVAINREGGEGRRISINGLGPEFSLTLLNGRQIASADTGRAFSFDTIAADLVGKVNVYKTANADVPEGGLGGTIDVRTARPFDHNGFKAVVSAEYLYEENSKKGHPQFSAILSNRFLDDRLGVMLSFVHQKRRARTYFTDAGGWSENYFVDPVTTAYVEDDEDEAWRSWNVQYGTVDSYRERNGGTASVQYEATDNLTFTADYLYSKFDVTEIRNSGGAYLWAVQDSPQSIRDKNGTYTQLDVSGGYNLGSYSFNNGTSYRPTVTQAAGYNVVWNAADGMRLDLDLSWSKAVTDNPGRNMSQTLEMLNQPGYLVIFPDNGKSPYFDFKGVDISAKERDLRARIVSNSGTKTVAENKEIKFDLGYEFSPSLRINIGTAYAGIRKNNRSFATPSVISRMYHKNAERQVITNIDNIITGNMAAGSQFGVSGSPFPVFLMDPVALRAWMADPVNLANRTQNPGGAGLKEFIANGSSWKATEGNSSYNIRERDFSAYGVAHLDLDMGSVPASIVLGLRYSRTNLASTGKARLISQLDNEGTVGSFQIKPIYASTVAQLTTVNTSYENWLPSFNAKFELTPETVFRLSATRSMARPTLGNLTPSITYGGLSFTQRSATANNPYLKPFVSTNFDASFEWYYSKHGAVAIAGFYKNIDNFIVSTTTKENFTNIGITSALQARDPSKNFQEFQVTRPRNAESATVKGLTFSWTHSLDMGVGAQVNYTLVRSSATEPAAGSTFAIPGVSDTMNAVLFYEKGPLSARVAYNWRDRYLVAVGSSSSLPVYADSYYQIDGRIGYEVGEGLTIGAEVNNLTKQVPTSHALYANQFVNYSNYGRQLRATLTKKF